MARAALASVAAVTARKVARRRRALYTCAARAASGIMARAARCAHSHRVGIGYRAVRMDARAANTKTQPRAIWQKRNGSSKLKSQPRSGNSGEASSFYSSLIATRKLVARKRQQWQK